MAAEIINTVLKAESAAKKEEAKAAEQKEAIISAAKQKAQDLYDFNIKQAQSEAALAVTQAQETAQGILKQAETLAKLREKKVISETEKRYGELIKTVLDHLV